MSSGTSRAHIETYLALQAACRKRETSSTSVQLGGPKRLHKRADVSACAAHTRWAHSLRVSPSWPIDPRVRLLGRSRECTERRPSASETSSVGIPGEHVQMPSMETLLTVMYCSFCTPARTTPPLARRCEFDRTSGRRGRGRHCGGACVLCARVNVMCARVGLAYLAGEHGRGRWVLSAMSYTSRAPSAASEAWVTGFRAPRRRLRNGTLAIRTYETAARDGLGCCRDHWCEFLATDDLCAGLPYTANRWLESVQKGGCWNRADGRGKGRGKTAASSGGRQRAPRIYHASGLTSRSTSRKIAPDASLSGCTSPRHPVRGTCRVASAHAPTHYRRSDSRLVRLTGNMDGAPAAVFEAV